MTFSKALLPFVALAASLGGCVYEETHTGYREPRRVHHGGYVERDVVVDRRSDYYREPRRQYHREREVTVYDDRPRAQYYEDRPRVYGGAAVIVSPSRHGESYKERQERQLREAQRAQEDRHDKKDDGHKKKKKKDHDDDGH